jgi:hypothetical protein
VARPCRHILHDRYKTGTFEKAFVLLKETLFYSITFGFGTIMSALLSSKLDLPLAFLSGLDNDTLHYVRLLLIHIIPAVSGNLPSAPTFLCRLLPSSSLINRPSVRATCQS